MNNFEKINIYVPAQIGKILKDDARLFEIFKKDRININCNRFLSMLIIGYYNSYALEGQNNFRTIQNVLLHAGIDAAQSEKVADSILRKIVLPDVPKRKGKKPINLPLKPTKETESIICKINQNLTVDDYISQYFCRMFMSYCEKPLYERERIIFKENVDILEEACKDSRPISFNSIWDCNIINEVIPFKIAIGQDEMFNYLLGQIFNEKTKKYEPRAFRLNRITGLSFSTSTISLHDDVRILLGLMEKYGAQYPILDEKESCVKLSERGLAFYNRIYHGRPKFDRIENRDDGYYLYFKCSKDQLFLYFRRFEGGTAEIIYPDSLRNRIIKFHCTVVDSYNRHLLI